MSAPVRQPLERLQLAELLDFRPDLGVIRLHEQRVVILSAAAMGLLRKELIDTFGRDIARRLLLRFGYADGYHDAVNLRARFQWRDPLEGLGAGAVLHTLEGIVRSEVVRLERDDEGRFDAEFTWYDSYEAEQHVHHYGVGDDPVCWSLAGYATGYTSACLGQEVYFRESACAGQGAKHCTIIGRDTAAWGDDLAVLRADFQGASLGDEIERLQAVVHRRARDLARRCRRCWSWPRRWRRSTRPCSSTARAAPARSSSSA